ncbi:hypothetical protein BC829DRAFT_59618 [Chytridium lagenaria]|nr:hypothetical protein BC829DRAFT_59618 [Chytridium lagenaria]
MMQSPVSYAHASHSYRDFKYGTPLVPSQYTQQTMQPPLITGRFIEHDSRGPYTHFHHNDNEVSSIFGGPSPWTEGESARVPYRSYASSTFLESHELLTAMPVGMSTSAKSDKGHLQMNLGVCEPANQDARNPFGIDNLISRRQSRRTPLYSRSSEKKKAVALPPTSPALSLNQGLGSGGHEPSVDGDQSSTVVTLPVSADQDPSLEAGLLSGSNVNEAFNTAVVTPPESSLDEGSSSAGITLPESSFDEGLNVDTTASLERNLIEGSSRFDYGLPEAPSVKAMSPTLWLRLASLPEDRFSIATRIRGLLRGRTERSASGQNRQPLVHRGGVRKRRMLNISALLFYLTLAMDVIASRLILKNMGSRKGLKMTRAGWMFQTRLRFVVVGLQHIVVMALLS